MLTSDGYGGSEAGRERRKEARCDFIGGSTGGWQLRVRPGRLEATCARINAWRTPAMFAPLARYICASSFAWPPNSTLPSAAARALLFDPRRPLTSGLDCDERNCKRL